MKKNTIILTIVLLISICFNIFFLSQMNSINLLMVSIENEKLKLETALSEKKTTITEKDIEIAELQTTIENLQQEIEALKGQLTALETEKAEINEELETAKKELEEVEQSESEPDKGTEQSSTVGGTGHTEEPAANPEYVPSDEPNQMDPTEAAAKFGMTFGGSGLDTSGFDHGGGGYGITLQ